MEGNKGMRQIFLANFEVFVFADIETIEVDSWSCEEEIVVVEEGFVEGGGYL
jgi:hypothetical protein